MSDIKSKTPRLVDHPPAGLELTAEERFLVARIDGRLSVSELAAITELEETRVEELVAKLASDGTVVLGEAPEGPAGSLGPDAGSTTTMAELASALGMSPSPFEAAGSSTPPQTDRGSDPTIVTPPDRGSDPTIVTPPDRGSDPTIDDHPPSEAAPDDDHPPSEAAPDDDHPPGEAAPDDDDARAAGERNYRKVYEERWHVLLVEQRIEGASVARGADLFALCFDADPHVIAAVLDNATCGPDHARLIAFHHRTGTGLEILTRRQHWLRDALVERRLLRNPMVGDLVLGRVMGPKRLLSTYKIAIDRDIPGVTRAKCRGYLRQKWQTAPSEDRADLLLRTEGRCLASMTGSTIDAKTTAILCGRPIHSPMLVQSLAKFAASPPTLLAYLVKQPFVRKSAPLKKMLLAHPNMPADVKRSV